MIQENNIRPHPTHLIANKVTLVFRSACKFQRTATVSIRRIPIAAPLYPNPGIATITYWSKTDRPIPSASPVNGVRLRSWAHRILVVSSRNPTTRGIAERYRIGSAAASTPNRSIAASFAYRKIKSPLMIPHVHTNRRIRSISRPLSMPASCFAAIFIVTV